MTLRGECWSVAGTDAFDHCTVWTLEGRGPGNAGRVFHAVTPFDHLAPAAANQPRLRKRRAVLRRALAALAGDRPALGLWTAGGARLDLLAYQLEPALAVLRGATRVLLADGVGLGKTVQAGLILAELRARGLADRALVLCPAGVREVWVRELRERFHIGATVLDQTSIALGLHELPAGINPWSAHSVVVASIDLVKRPDVLAAVEEVAFDLVIADEAHHLTPGSDRGHAVGRLGTRAPWLVLLSATPHSGDQGAFDYLAALGSLGDTLTVFRRSRRDIGLASDRRVQLLGIAPTADEASLLRATDEYARAIWQARGQSDRAVQLVAITLSRRAASSAAALAHTLTRRRALLSDTLPSPAQPALPWDELDEEDGDEPDERLARPGLDEGEEERRRLDALIDLAHRAAAGASKLRRLSRFLRRAGEPAVVFTEYRDTLHAAADALACSFRLGTIHGGVPAPMRQEVLRRFEGGDIQVLLATDTVGEGLNLHRRCRLVVDLELPWNPRRLEQRVGRVDRLGQRRRVHAVHLLHRGSIEERVWCHLERRRVRAGQTLGDHGSPTETEVARTIFDAVPLPAPGATVVASTRIDAATELSRAVDQRRWLPWGHAALDRPVFAMPRRFRRRGWIAIAVHEQSTFRETGGLVERRVRASVVDIGPANTAAAWRALAEAIQPAGPQDKGEAAQQAWWHHALARIALARNRLTEQSPLLQASLFDRRAERAARSRREVIARLDDALARRAQSLGAAARPSHSRLIAFWPHPRQS